MIRNSHMKAFAALFAAVMVVSMLAPTAGAAVASGADDATTDLDDIDGLDVELDSSVGAEDGLSSDVRAQAAGSPSVDPALEEEFRTADDTVDVVVRLGAADLDGVTGQQATIDSLEAHADATQTDVLGFSESTDGVETLNRFHIANAVLLEVDPDAVSLERLTELNGVERLHANFEMTIDEDDEGAAADGDAADGDDLEADPTPENESYTYGLEQANVPDVWENLGVTGEGAGVAILDTGLDNDHPDFDLDTDNWVEFDDDGEEVDSDPNDGDGHGTHVSGTAVGPQDPDGDVPAYGVAPDAELYSAKVLDDTGGGSFAQIAAGMEWAAEQEDVDVVGMSLGAPGYVPDMIEPAENIRDAGQILSVSIGNSGQDNSGSPGNYYSTFGSGAVDESDELADFSSGEEIDTDGAWGDDAPDYWPDEYVQPNAAAAGVDVLSAYVGTDYSELSGTSMSQPHKAGTFALMASAMGDTDVELFEDIVEDTAEQPDDAPDDDPNTEFGHGIINAYEATQQVALDSGVEGTVTDGDDEPIEGATVDIEDGGEAVTDEDGHYELIAEPGEYTLTATGFGYEEVEETVDIPDNETVVEQDFELDDALGVELLEDQPDGIEGGEAFEVVVDVANLETYTVESDGDYDGDLTFELNGDEIEEGEEVDVGDLTGEATLSVTTEADIEGDLSLDHTFEGHGDTVEVTTGPTQVFEEFVPVAVVDDEEFGEDVVDRLEDELSDMYDVSLISGDEAVDAAADGEYDTYVVQTMDADIETFLDDTDDDAVGVVWLDQWGSTTGADAIPQKSDAVDNPTSTDDGFTAPNPDFEITEDHPVFDGIGDVGDTLPVHSADFADATWFDGYDGDVIGHIQSGSVDDGDGIAVDEEKNTMLLSSFGSNTFVADEFSEEADMLLGNAVEYVTSEEEDDEEAAFEVADVDPSGDFEVDPGAELEVNATIENTGDTAGTQDVEFVFDGEAIATEELELDAGEEETVTFEITAPEEEGDYDWFVATDDDESPTWTLTVVDDAPPAEDTVGFGDGEFVFAPGETSNVTMNTSADVAGYEVFADFDPELLEIEDIEAVDLDGPLSTDIDNENGTFAAAQAQANNETAPDMLDVEVTFLGDAEDTANLEFDESESAVFASDGEVDVDFEDAEFVSGQLGDVNLDGEIDAFDAILIQQFIGDQEPEDDFFEALADVTQDGEIHTGDVIAVLDVIVEDGGDDADGLDEQQDAASIDLDGAAAAAT